MFRIIQRMKARDKSGFTLIELLIVVAIIGILAAVAIPGYIGMQEKGRKGSVLRAAGAAEADLQGWLQSARKGGSTLWEVDSSGDGLVTSALDVTNSQLALDLGASAGLCSRYIIARWNLNPENSPWDPTASSLWTTANTNATANGRISCFHGAGSPQVILTVYDKDGTVPPLYRKVISAD